MLFVTLLIKVSFPSRKIRGSLKICSRSLIFDPDDFKEPILKVCFQKVAFILTSLIFVLSTLCEFHRNEVVFIDADSTSRLQEDRVCGEREQPVC